MDELEISGVRYISTRRAGKEYSYHPDYIGQLIRGGKITGKKVGRAWYVDSDALRRFLKGEEQIPTEKLVKPPHISSPTSAGRRFLFASEPQVTEKVLPHIHLTVKEELNISKDSEIKKSPIPSKLKYISDNTALLPVLGQKNTHPSLKNVFKEEPTLIALKQTMYAKKKISFSTLIFIGIVILVASFLFSSGLISSLATDQTNGFSKAFIFDFSYLGSLANFVKP